MIWTRRVFRREREHLRMRIAEMLNLPSGLRSRMQNVIAALATACMLLTVIVVLAAAEPFDPMRRLGAAIAGTALLWWWLRGYRRRAFSVVGAPLETMLLTLIVACIGTSGVLNLVALSTVLFHSLYGRARDLAVSIVSLTIATTVGITIAVRLGYETAISETDMWETMVSSVATLSILGGIMSWVSYAAGRYEEVVGRENALNITALRLATAERREDIRLACLEAVTSLLAEYRAVTADINLDAKELSQQSLSAADSPPRSASAPERRRWVCRRTRTPRLCLYRMPITSHDTAYGSIALTTGAPLSAEIQLAIEGLASTCAMALRAVDLSDDLRHRAFHDGLTGLANRDLFHRQASLAQGLADHERIPFAVVMIDLDGFKAVNDGYGHAFGDAVLRRVAERIEAQVHAGDLAARLGGDEFAILVKDVSRGRDPLQLADRLLRTLSEPITDGTVTVAVGASIGVSIWRGHRNVDQLMREADAAMYAAKCSGKNRVVMAGPARASS